MVGSHFPMAEHSTQSSLPLLKTRTSQAAGRLLRDRFFPHLQT